MCSTMPVSVLIWGKKIYLRFGEISKNQLVVVRQTTPPWRCNKARKMPETEECKTKTKTKKKETGSRRWGKQQSRSSTYCNTKGLAQHSQTVRQQAKRGVCVCEFSKDPREKQWVRRVVCDSGGAGTDDGGEKVSEEGHTWMRRRSGLSSKIPPLLFPSFHRREGIRGGEEAWEVDGWWHFAILRLFRVEEGVIRGVQIVLFQNQIENKSNSVQPNQVWIKY